MLQFYVINLNFFPIEDQKIYTVLQWTVFEIGLLRAFGWYTLVTNTEQGRIIYDNVETNVLGLIFCRRQHGLNFSRLLT